MKQPTKSILTTAIVTSSVGTIYYSSSGFPHLFVSSDELRIAIAFVLFIVFLIAFFTAVQLTPAKPEACPRCGYHLKAKKDSEANHETRHRPSNRNLDITIRKKNDEDL